MARTDFKSVDEYMAAQADGARPTLRSVRAAIRKALPGSEETMSYGIPTYRVDGRAVIYFAGWKQHYSVYPATSRVIAALEDELKPYEVEKGTIRFPFSGRVPARLIARIAKLRAQEDAERTRTKRPASKARPK
jgi:uncharacterized protein YdhG (YjbR/CyaY superfamily)